MKRIFIVASVLLMTIFLAPNIFAQENRALWSLSTYIQSAKIQYKVVYGKSHRREDLQVAIDLMKEAATKYPRVPEVYLMIGSFYSEINALDTMVAYFDSVQVSCSDTTVDQKYRKNCEKGDKYIESTEKIRQSFWEKRYNEAVKFVTQYDTVIAMIGRAPSEDSAKVLDGLKQKAFDAAQEDFKQAIMLKPQNPTSYNGYGILLDRDKKFEDAIEQFKKAMQLKGEDADGVSRIAYAYISIPDWTNSAIWFERLLDYSPKDINARINVIICYNALNEYDKAYAHIEKLLEQEPDNAQGLFFAGQHWFMKMQDEAAAMSSISDSTAEGKAKRAEMDSLTNQYRDKATGFYSKVVEKNPKDADALRALGILYLLSQQPQKAIDTFEKYEAVDPENTTVLDFLGRAYIMNGEFNKAIAPYEKLVEIDPGNVDAWDRLAQLYDNTKQPDKADKARKTAADLGKL